MKDKRNEYPLAQAVNLGTVYPSESSWEMFEKDRQKLADNVNEGDIGDVVTVYDNNRGIEEFFAPDLNATWKYNFS